MRGHVLKKLSAAEIVPVLRTADVWRLAVLCVAISASFPARGEEPTTAGTQIARPVLPGIGARDPRRRIDPDAAPWRAVGKLQAAPGSFHMSCTGTLIGRDVVLTAAHCLFDPQTEHFLPPRDFHFLVGYSGERMTGHARGVRYVIGPGYDPKDPTTLGADWALLTIDHPFGADDRILPLLGHAPAPGVRVMLGGYSLDHRYILTADSDCRILGFAADQAGHPLIHHDCTTSRGVSGAPLLLQENGKWQVAGVEVMATMGKAEGYAVMPDTIRKQR
jgi:protease YdgD